MATSQPKSVPRMNFLTSIVEVGCRVIDTLGVAPRELDDVGKAPPVKLPSLKEELQARREVLLLQQRDTKAAITGLLEVYKRQKVELDNIETKLTYL